MSYDSKELSVQDSAPVMLFQFVQGASTYRYTSLMVAITRSGYVWSPVAIKCGNISNTGDLPKEQLSIELPYTDALALTFIQYPPDAMTSITVFRTHYDDTEVDFIWKGRVVNSQVNNGVLQLACEPIFTSLQRKTLRVCYQRTCPHVFGEVGTCNFDAATVTTVNEATIAYGAELNIPTAVGLVDTDGRSMIEGGTLTYAGVTRMIVAHSGVTVTLMRPISALTIALAVGPVNVSICESCSHELDDATRGCRARGNAGNFGGWPGIPLKNPMNNGITVNE